MKFRFFVITVALLIGRCVSQTLPADACSRYNVTYGPTSVSGGPDGNQHISGNHSAVSLTTGSCVYSNPSSGRACVGHAAAIPGVMLPAETGNLNAVGSHVSRNAQERGDADGAGVAVDATTHNRIAFFLCTTPSCQFSLSSPIVGVGNPPGTVWDWMDTYQTKCPAKAATSGGSGGGGGGGGAGKCTGRPTSPFLTDPGYSDPTGINDDPCSVSPVVVATKHGDFKFTDPQTHCTIFDLRANGKPNCYSWPAHGSGVGFLALDRDDDGTIESGAELFGDYTPQSHHYNPTDPNGFLALAEYDLPEFGGNWDGVIDEQDAIWSKLKIWIDDHCYLDRNAQCFSRPGELHSLQEFHIESVDLKYGPGDREDKWGNDFKFATLLNVDKDQPGDDLSRMPHGQHHRYHGQHSHDSRKAYDVFLVMKTN